MTIYIVDIEGISTRYTGEWKEHVPALIRNRGHDVVVIEGPEDLPDCTTPGAFLNFAGTNVYKADQVRQMAQMFSENRVKDGDQFLFTDAWHPGIINLRYMADLLGIKIITHGLHHAGSYDPQDFLGRLIGNESGWCRYAELSMFEAYDHNWYATQEHINLLGRTQLRHHSKQEIQEMRLNGKLCKTGWPMEYLRSLPNNHLGVPKQDKILFPHRIAPEKQAGIFRDLALHLPEYDFIVCQDQQLTKDQYHQHLSESKIVFSANLQETLGITTCGEGPLFGAVPLAPARLTYTEIFSQHEEFLYPSQWTLSWEHYELHRDELVDKIRETINRYDQLASVVDHFCKTSLGQYFHADVLLDVIDNHARKSV